MAWDNFKRFLNYALVSGPITSWEIDGETVETVSDFIFWRSQITAESSEFTW